MTNLLTRSKHVRSAFLSTAAACCAATVFAAVPQVRITSPIDNQNRVELTGSLSPRAIAANDAGRVPATTQLTGIQLVFSRTPAQQAALDALTTAQQTPGSPQYHHFLTPEQFGAQFGAAPADIATAQAWLQQQGFTLQGVTRSLDRIEFSATEAQVESAFGAQLHYFVSPSGEKNLAPATTLTIPAALATSVLAVTNLSSFRPHAHAITRGPVADFTSGQSGSVFLTPRDVATIYDVNAAYNAGYNGAGQSIAAMGQSSIVAADITNFQSALGIAAKAPTQILVPNTGSAAISSGDESESDLDLEYSSAMAPGASVYFVYTGNGNSNGVFSSLQYAVSNAIANIITISYGECEQDLGAGNYAQLNAILQQGAAQGQTIIASAGDSGSTSCFDDTSDAAATREALASSFPASSQYVTSMGGTEISSANESSTYFTASTGTDVVSSAKSYIPEIVWNDDAYAVSKGATGTGAISAGGGGVSIFTPIPSWQAGVTGISGSYRLLPDISLLASQYFPGYLYCSSDIETGVTGSCSHGFRDTNSQYLTVAGGTSFDAPIFAGLVAVLNQAKGYTTGQGLVNPELYTLASNSIIYASAFHDINTGGNECAAGTSYCSTAGAASYFAANGYDEATGLGSIDFYNLLTAWPASTSTAGLTASVTTITAASPSPSLNTADAITISVASASSTITTVPTGTVSIYANGTQIASNLTLTNGTLTYTYTGATVGQVLLKAVYNGNTIYAASNSFVTLNVGAYSLGLTSTNVTVAQGSTGTTTFTLTPVSGYTGTFQFTSFSYTGALTNACITTPANIVITGTAPGTSTMQIITNGNACPAGTTPLARGTSGSFNRGGGIIASTQSRKPFTPASELAFASLLIVGFFARRSRKLRSIVLLCLLVVTGMGLTGCSNTATTALPVSTTSAAKGTYTITLYGADTANSSITANTTFTLVID